MSEQAYGECPWCWEKITADQLSEIEDDPAFFTVEDFPCGSCPKCQKYICIGGYEGNYALVFKV